MSMMSECIARWGGSSSCAARREELGHQSGGGVSVLGGAEKQGGGGGCGPASGTARLLITRQSGKVRDSSAAPAVRVSDLCLVWPPREVCASCAHACCLLWAAGGSRCGWWCSWWGPLLRIPEGKGDRGPECWGGSAARAGCGWSYWAHCSPAANQRRTERRRKLIRKL